VSRGTCGDYRVLTTNAHGLRVQRAPGISLRPLFLARINEQDSGASRREIMTPCRQGTCSPDERSDIRDHSNTAPDIASLIRATGPRLRANTCCAWPRVGNPTPLCH